jgi:outer membrane protein
LKLFLGLITTIACAYADTSLGMLIDAAHHNEKIKALQERAYSTSLTRQTVRGSYMPRVDLFGSGSFVSPVGGFDAAQSYYAGAKAEFLLFDGFKRENTFDQFAALENASAFNVSGGKKEMSLQVIRLYYELQNTLDEIQTYTKVQEQLEAQLARLQQFRSAGLTSDDVVLRLRASLANTVYEIEDLHYKSDQQKAELTLLTNLPIETLANSVLKEPTIVAKQELDSIKAMRLSTKATQLSADASDTGFWPTLSIADQYTVSKFVDDPIAAMRVENQNKFTLSATLNLLDFSTMSTKKQSLIAQANEQANELLYATKKADSSFVLAQKYVQRSQKLLDAALLAYDASQKSFETVKQKYESRLVDYVTYLDALTVVVSTTNQLNTSKRMLYYAYASYYYFGGLDPKDYVQ